MKFLLFLLLILPGCAHLKVDKWDAVEIGEAAALTVLMAIDHGQTSMIVRNPDRYREMNPIMGEHPSQATVNIFFPAALAFKLGVAHFLPSEWRLLSIITGLGLDHE